MKAHDIEFWSAEINRDTPSLDIHGYRVAEALEKIDTFIDQQSTGKYRIIKVIHGSGTGALRKALRGLLATHPQVSAYRDSERVEELAAVTYIILK
ncbi:MAG: Smr/MutS family protein [Candidatus Magasanikbacteria bacterium]|nr:Smr/MutS family protein [Candidatus Magasanikbacteria bacterium]